MQIRVDTLDAALAETDQQIQQLEQEVAAQADKVQRTATAKAVEQFATDLTVASSDLDRALAAMSALAEKIAPWCPDAMGVHIFTDSARGEIEAATLMLQTLLRSHATGVLNGGFAIPLGSARTSCLHCDCKPIAALPLVDGSASRGRRPRAEMDVKTAPAARCRL
jgi:hypothetical protein